MSTVGRQHHPSRSGVNGAWQSARDSRRWPPCDVLGFHPVVGCHDRPSRGVEGSWRRLGARPPGDGCFAPDRVRTDPCVAVRFEGPDWFRCHPPSFRFHPSAGVSSCSLGSFADLSAADPGPLRSRLVQMVQGRRGRRRPCAPALRSPRFRLPTPASSPPRGCPDGCHGGIAEPDPRLHPMRPSGGLPSLRGLRSG